MNIIILYYFISQIHYFSVYLFSPGFTFVHHQSIIDKKKVFEKGIYTLGENIYYISKLDI